MKVQNVTVVKPDKNSKEAKKHHHNHGGYSISKGAVVGSTVGTLGSVLGLSKLYNGKLGFDIFDNPSTRKNVAAIAAVSGAAILGGLIGGMSGAKGEDDKKAKISESIYSYSIAALPTAAALGVSALLKKKNINNMFLKVAAPVASIFASMPIAQALSNKISDKTVYKDKSAEEKQDLKRNLKPLDFLVHADDLVPLLLITKPDVAKKFHIDKLLPVIYAWFGIKAGSVIAKHNEQNKH